MKFLKENFAIRLIVEIAIFFYNFVLKLSSHFPEVWKQESGQIR
jgi:hypothetical protein